MRYFVNPEEIETLLFGRIYFNRFESTEPIEFKGITIGHDSPHKEKNTFISLSDNLKEDQDSVDFDKWDKLLAEDSIAEWDRVFEEVENDFKNRPMLEEAFLESDTYNLKVYEQMCHRFAKDYKYSLVEKEIKKEHYILMVVNSLSMKLIMMMIIFV